MIDPSMGTIYHEKSVILAKHYFSGNTIVHMYAKNGSLDKTLSVQEQVSWNAPIVRYAENGENEEVLSNEGSMATHCLTQNGLGRIVTSLFGILYLICLFKTNGRLCCLEKKYTCVLDTCLLPKEGFS